MRRLSTKSSTPKVIDSQEDDLLGLNSSPFWTRSALSCLSLLAVLKLGSEFYRLIWETGSKGAIDLAQRHSESLIWFSGQTLYGVISHATYPPASQLILGPLVGWENFQFVRWLWALLSVLSLIWLVRLLIRQCDSRSLAESIFVALIPLSMNATGISVGNGQLSVLILPLLVQVVALAREGRRSWNTDFAIVVLFILALVKPTFSAPFFLILLLVSPGFGIAAVIVLGYLLLTFISSMFQEPGMFRLTANWLEHASTANNHGAVNLDYGSIHVWLAALELSHWNSIASVLLLFVLGFWIYRFRHVDLWLLFGVTAIGARLWTYHGLYDDMLIIVPIIALLRNLKAVSKGSSPSSYAQFLLMGSIFVMLVPARLFFVWPVPWPHLYAVSHLFFWLLLLLYLLSAAYREGGPNSSGARALGDAQREWIEDK